MTPLAKKCCKSPATKLNSLKFLKGKTIKDIDDSSVNCVNIQFTDDTVMYLEAEQDGIFLATVGYLVRASNKYLD